MKMKRIASICLFLLSATVLISCGNADDDVSLNLNTGGDLGLGKPADNCLDFGENELILSIQDQFTTLPG